MGVDRAVAATRETNAQADVTFWGVSIVAGKVGNLFYALAGDFRRTLRPPGLLVALHAHAEAALTDKSSEGGAACMY